MMIETREDVLVRLNALLDYVGNEPSPLAQEILWWTIVNGLLWSVPAILAFGAAVVLGLVHWAAVNEYSKLKDARGHVTEPSAREDVLLNRHLSAGLASLGCVILGAFLLIPACARANDAIKAYTAPRLMIATEVQNIANRLAPAKPSAGGGG